MKEPKKRKRVFAKIITIVCCLSIVLTLTVVPCFASGYKNSTGKLYYYGIPYTLSGVYNSTTYDSIYIDDALCIVATDTLSVVNSGVSYYNTGNLGDIYSTNMSIWSYCPSGGVGVNSAISFTSPGEAITNKAIYHHFIDTDIGNILARNALYPDTLIIDRINSMSSYESLYGVDYVNIKYDSVISLEYDRYLGSLYFLTLSDSISSLDNYIVNFDITCDVYHYDEIAGLLIDNYTGVYTFDPNWFATNYVYYHNYLNRAYSTEFDVALYECSVISGNIYDYIYRSYDDYEHVYADNVSINISLVEKQPTFTSNPLMSDIKAAYGNPSIVACGWDIGSNSIASNIIDEWENNFYVTLGNAPEHEYVSLEDFNLLNWLGNTLGGVMSTRIIGPITIGSVLYVAVGVGFVMLVLKFFAGG